ncbi:MAG TPA: DUF2017 family protein [Acidimicrobiales bacterium]|nr:DUF2017 family protein [Acidimicrobiales bacterium]
MTGRRRFVRDRDGRIRPGLDRTGRQLLQSLPRQAQGLLEHDDPSAARVFPVAYPDDERAEAEYRETIGSQLLQRHQRALDTLAATVDSPTVDEDELRQWLGALEILRLVLGTQLDVSEDMTEVSPFDPQAQQLAVYQYLSILQGEIVDTLAESLPVVEEDDLTADDLLDDGFGDVSGHLLDDELDDPNWMDFPDDPGTRGEGPAGRGR